MSGIVAYGAYIPVFRLKRDAISRMWGTGGDTTGEKAVAYFDEDSVTMAVAAGRDCLIGVDRQKIESLSFASVSPPYGEKQSAAIIAMALDLPDTIRTADHSHSLRSGTTALISALDAVKAGSVKNALVVAADCRLASPHSDQELLFGDGAAAIAVGDSNVIAEVEGMSSVYNEVMDVWRQEAETGLRAWEDRFTMSKGYTDAVQKVVSATLAKYNLKPADFAKVAMYGPDARNHSALAKTLGFTPKQIQDPMFNTVGNTGSASPLMLLAAALEESKPGDRILVLGYGNGADSLIFRVTDEISKLPSRRGVKGHLKSAVPLEEYRRYAVWRGLIEEDTAKRPAGQVPSATCLWRDRKRILTLVGSKCKKCGTVQYPPQRVCVKCQTKDEFDDYKLSDLPVKVVTFTIDYLATTKDSPSVYTWVDFPGSGRFHCEMTDHALQKPTVGCTLEMCFRKLFTAGGVNNYFWKSRPVR